jgi:hypothetical protein
MNRTVSQSGVSRHRWYQFRLRTLLGFQAAALLGLAWGYLGGDPDFRWQFPGSFEFGVFAAPVLATFVVLTFRSIYNGERHRRVFSLMASGALAGTGLGLIGFAPVVVQELREAAAESRWPMELLPLVAGMAFGWCIVGTTIGGMVGIARDYLPRAAANSGER